MQECIKYKKAYILYRIDTMLRMYTSRKNMFKYRYYMYLIDIFDSKEYTNLGRIKHSLYDVPSIDLYIESVIQEESECGNMQDLDLRP